ncbi:MAG: hypothetical protein JXQ75_03435 [Phycisphaerae bacterium]|nr:hypothetical protein [Phycisphaerae bacterium]
METELKSRLFSKFDPAEKDNDLFGKHLRKALDLVPGQMVACIDALADLRLARIEPEKDRLLDSLERETRLPQTELAQVIAVTRFFLDRMLRDEYKHDTSEQWADDLVTLRQIEESTRPLFVSMVDRIRSDVLPKVESAIRRRAYGEGVLPGLKTCGTTVEMRAVQKGRYRWGTAIKEYEPRILDVAGVVSVHIGLNEGTPRDFYFQMSEDDLQLLIRELEAARKDLWALSEFVSTRRQSGDVKP